MQRQEGETHETGERLQAWGLPAAPITVGLGTLLRVHTHHPPCFTLDDCKEEADGGILKLRVLHQSPVATDDTKR